MLLFMAMIIILGIVYYTTVAITLITNEFKSKKDLVFSIIPFGMWYRNIKTMYNRLP